jgi:hypothetical protein
MAAQVDTCCCKYCDKLFIINELFVTVNAYRLLI